LRSSSSGHHLNGDRRLSAVAKAGYFLCNWINNSFPNTCVDPQMALRNFVRDDLATRWSDLPRRGSPSRTVCDLFWATLPWPSIRATLGDVHMLDVGCGSGHYGPRLLASADQAIASYTGTDATPRSSWTELRETDSRLRFYQSRAEDFGSTIPSGTNMFISQSSIEHFDEDLTFFRQIRDYVSSVAGPVLQIHLAPSQACLRLYTLHGVRQYTPRTLSRITRLFGTDSHRTLFRLGGKACNRLHFASITRPSLLHGRDLRNDEPEEYERRLFEAVSHDMRHPQSSPAFWALVILSKSHTSLFE